jgi:hypothetical protein
MSETVPRNRENGLICILALRWFICQSLCLSPAPLHPSQKWISVMSEVKTGDTIRIHYKGIHHATLPLNRKSDPYLRIPVYLNPTFGQLTD